jgi:predicted ester cyclase
MAQPAETVLHRWFEEVWNQGRESSIDELMADGALIHGAADFKPFHRQFRAAFPDMRITVEDMLVDGDKLAARCSVTATHTGPGIMSGPTNKAVSITGICIARVANGKIAEGWNNFDFLSLYQQLGMQLS